MEIVKSFIPRHMRNSTVMAVYDLLRRKTNRISENVIHRNAEENMRLLYSQNGLYTPQNVAGWVMDKNVYIENQAQWEKIRFGNGKKSNMSYSGCGVIAVYNALAALRENVSLDTIIGLISVFERDGAILNGRFGIAPSSIYDYFRDRGFETTIVIDNDMEKINNIEKCYKAAIITAYNNKNDITDMIHTVCMSKRENGEYVIHNGYRKNALSGTWEEFKTGIFTLADAIPKIGRDSAAISIIGINAR